MKIQLTTEQIAVLVKGETEKLQKMLEADKLKLQKQYELDLNKMIKKCESDIAKLENKFKYIVIEDEKLNKRVAKIDMDILMQMIKDKKTIKEMATFFNTTEISIRNKLSRKGIKLTNFR